VIDDPELIARLLGRGGIPVLTETAVRHLLEQVWNGGALVSDQARPLLSWLRRPGSNIAVLPNGVAARKDERLIRREFRGGSVISIDSPAVADVSDSKGLFALVSDYGLCLLSPDRTLVERAKAAGVLAVLKKGRDAKPSSGKAAQSGPPRVPIGATLSCVQPFEMPGKPSSKSDSPLHVSRPLITGEAIHTPSGKSLRVGEKISEGGEGIIFRLSDPSLVCKVYHEKCRTRLRKQKIELMLSRPVRRPGLCWPEDLALNSSGEFVGYLMPKAEGRQMQTAMFIRPVLEKSFPAWQRKDLVKLCIAFLEHVEFLHQLNIVIGDINPLNLLLTADSTRLWVVDTDSFQIEGFPCPVGTVNFTPPNLQGKEYAKFLRTKEDELFAVATMLFMILHPGKPPYSQQGGGTPTDNIKMGFPYGIRNKSLSRNAPEGPWMRVWRNLAPRVAESFYQTFQLNQRVAVSVWLSRMREYLKCLENGELSNELFPSTLPVFDGIPATCGKCGQQENGPRKKIEGLRAAGTESQFRCTRCSDKERMMSLAKKSNNATRRTPTAQPYVPSPAQRAPSAGSPRSPLPSSVRTTAPPPKPSFPDNALLLLAIRLIGKFF
jgi:serine/threonine protein kinase